MNKLNLSYLKMIPISEFTYTVSKKTSKCKLLILFLSLNIDHFLFFKMLMQFVLFIRSIVVYKRESFSYIFVHFFPFSVMFCSFLKNLHLCLRTLVCTVLLANVKYGNQRNITRINSRYHYNKLLIGKYIYISLRKLPDFQL